MTRKKNGFWTFIFSLLPGAGEMYMGFMKQGVSLMGIFFLTIFLAGWFQLGPLLFLLPIIWFYGFFHVHNLKALPDEEFYAVEDEFMFHLDAVFPKERFANKKYRNAAAAVLIVIGVSILFNNVGGFLQEVLPVYLRSWYWQITDMLPQLILAVVLIIFGVWLISGKKKALDAQEAEGIGEKE